MIRAGKGDRGNLNDAIQLRFRYCGCDATYRANSQFSFPFFFFFCVSGGSGGELSACDNASHAFNEFRVSAAKFALMERAASSIIASANVRLLRVALKWFVSDGRN